MKWKINSSTLSIYCSKKIKIFKISDQPQIIYEKQFPHAVTAVAFADKLKKDNYVISVGFENGKIATF